MDLDKLTLQVRGGYVEKIINKKKIFYILSSPSNFKCFYLFFLSFLHCRIEQSSKGQCYYLLHIYIYNQGVIMKP